MHEVHKIIGLNLKLNYCILLLFRPKRLKTGNRSLYAAAKQGDLEKLVYLLSKFYTLLCVHGCVRLDVHTSTAAKYYTGTVQEIEHLLLQQMIKVSDIYSLKLLFPINDMKIFQYIGKYQQNIS